MYKTFSMELAGRTLSVDVGRVAAQANGAAFMHYGETTVLSTATASEKPREGIDFFPLSVEFEEKLRSSRMTGFCAMYSSQNALADFIRHFGKFQIIHNSSHSAAKTAQKLTTYFTLYHILL